MQTAPSTKPAAESPVYLIAGLYSAHVSGDRELERVQRKRLREGYGIRVAFDRPATQMDDLTAEGRDDA